MTYAEAKEVRNALEAIVRANGKTLRAFPRKGAMGLPTEGVRQSPSYKAAKRAYDQAFVKLQLFNQYFVSEFAQETEKERNSRRAPVR